MKKRILSFLLIAMISFHLVACASASDSSNIHQSENLSNEETSYHENDEINNLIIKYNEISETPIAENEVSTDFKDQTFINTQDVTVRISINSLGTFIDYDTESTSNEVLYEIFNTFTKCVISDISDGEIKNIFDELLTGQYSAYTKYTYKNMSSTYSESNLSNGDTRYTLKTEFAE